MPSYRCESCHELTGGRDVLEVRKEFRRLADLKSERIWLVRVVCRACATAEFERHDNPSGAWQTSLPLGGPTP